jgi:hypothetical protein
VTDQKQDDTQSDWEDEGGATAPEPKQRTEKGLEIPVPKRKDVRRVFEKAARSVSDPYSDSPASEK